MSSVSASVRNTTDCWLCGVWSNDELLDDGMRFDCESGVGRSRSDSVAASPGVAVSWAAGLCGHFDGANVVVGGGDRRLSLTGLNMTLLPVCG